MTTQSDHNQLIARLEELGEAQVRLLLAKDGFPTQLNLPITKWLADKDQEAGRIKEASQAEQLETARSAKDAAWAAATAAERASAAAERQAVAAERANRRATLALVIAVISIIATIVLDILKRSG